MKAIAFRLWFLPRVDLDARGRPAVWRAIELNAAEVPDAPYTDAAIRAALLAAAPNGADPLPGRVVLAFADELLERPELLGRFVGQDATLAVDAPDPAPLAALVEQVPGAQECDVLALPTLDAVGRARLAERADAVLSERRLALAAPRL